MKRLILVIDFNQSSTKINLGEIKIADICSLRNKIEGKAVGIYQENRMIV